MCVAANAHLQKIFSKTQNCALWNSNICITTCFVLPLQWLPRVTRSSSQSPSHQIGGWAYPDQMADQGRADESHPIAHYRSGYLPQAFAYNQLGSVWSLPQAVASTLPPSYCVRSRVGRKSKEDRSWHYNTDCGHSSGLATHGQNRMWGEGCQKLYYAVCGHSHHFALHAPYQMMDEDHSP
jgi:hypothetical protein